MNKKEQLLMIFAEMFIEDNKGETLGDRADVMARAYNKIDQLITSAQKEQLKVDSAYLKQRIAEVKSEVREECIKPLEKLDKKYACSCYAIAIQAIRNR